jgi:protein TonB
MPIKARATPPGARRSALTLIESGRAIGSREVLRTLLGMSAHLATVASTVVVMSIDFRITQANEDAPAPVYIAPEKKDVSRASEERLSYVGLTGDVRGAPEPELSDFAPPAPELPIGSAQAGTDIVEDISVPSSALEEFALSEIQVDSVVTTDPTSGGPAYPPTLLNARVEGEVLARFIVDSTGRADPVSFMALQASDTAFTNAVRAALPLMKFRPARLRGTPVPQVVVQSFAFRIQELPKDSTKVVPPIPGRGR